MKSLQDRSEQMISVKRVGERAYLMIQYREAAVVLKDVPCSDPRTWLSLQEEAGSLRAMLQTALTAYVEEILAEKALDRASSRLHAAEATRPSGHEAQGRAELHAELQPAPEMPRRNRDKILYGLPCPQCGAYFDSDLSGCPFCSRTSSEEFAPPPTQRESGKPPLTVQ